MRWRELYEPVAQDIIRLFKPDSDLPLEVMRTSLQRLARELGIDIDTARAGLAVLVGEPDFSANRDPELIAEHAVIEISVDWEVFAEHRIGITAGPDEDS